MIKKLIKLTPLEPYFFGGERIFEFDGGNKHYFIRSLDRPSQTTLFGVLRFLGHNPVNRRALKADDIDNIGANSFALTKGAEDSAQNFGRIGMISPLYLIDIEGNYYIRTPFDHNEKSPKGDCYSPFEMSEDVVLTNRGVRKLPKPGEFDPKAGVADSWLRLTDMTVHTDLFKGVVRVGIDKKNREKAFVKKEFKQLKEGFSFAFIATVSDEFKLYCREAFIGQGKSTFSVDVLEAHKFKAPDFTEFKKRLRSKTVYAQSDVYYESEAAQLYNECSFVCVRTRDFRVFTTDYDATDARSQYKKDRNIKLLQAGSIFIPNLNRLNEFTDALQKNKHAEKAGFNQTIVGGPGNE